MCRRSINRIKLDGGIEELRKLEVKGDDLRRGLNSGHRWVKGRRAGQVDGRLQRLIEL